MLSGESRRLSSQDGQSDGSSDGIVRREQHLGAVFVNHAAAEGAVGDLRRMGLSDEHLGVAVYHSDSYMFETDDDAEVTHGLEKGIAIGTPIGAVAGMTIMALAVPGVGILGVGGVLAAGGLSGAFLGAVLGSSVALSSEGHAVDEELDWELLPLQPGQVLVVVAGHGHSDEVQDVLRRHGGRLVAKPRI